MALLATVGRKSLRGRLFLTAVYLILILLGTTMIVPFLITISNSTTNGYDYARFRPIPRYFYSQNDRYLKSLTSYFTGFRGAMSQFNSSFPEKPVYWTGWGAIGRDIDGDEFFARNNIDAFKKHEKENRRAAADYAKFCMEYPLEDSVVTIQGHQAIRFMEQYYTTKLLKEKPEFRNKSRKEQLEAALELVGKTWQLPYSSFYGISFDSEVYAPMNFQQYFPETQNAKYQDYLHLKEYYHAQYFTPGVKGKWLDYLKEKKYKYSSEEEVFPVLGNSSKDLKELWGNFYPEEVPASPCMPYALRTSWISYLKGERAAPILKLKAKENFTVETYNRYAGTTFKSLYDTPFPLPENFGNKELRKAWEDFRFNQWPLRLTTLIVNSKTQKLYTEFLKKNIKHIRVLNELFGTKNSSWSQFKLTTHPPKGSSQFERNVRGIWGNFAAQIPLEYRIQTSSEIKYQKFLLEKYGSVKKINEAYHWDLKNIEYAFPAFKQAYTRTFLNNETAFTLIPILENYQVIASYLLLNSNAVLVTLLLIALTILCTLTINPLAAYALSRFRIRGKELIILFMLSTMAFPAMISAIPSYLLMRDLGMLNTFAALVLPGAASGMSIFVLKGFFDSLPPELFEAATIDGASESQIFRIIAMPMVKPILAISCLNAFIGAYNGWSWALIICQEKSMWTIAVWMYQATWWWSPWIISAGFVVTSIPTFLVFISCQKMILKGIVIPSMK